MGGTLSALHARAATRVAQDADAARRAHRLRRAGVAAQPLDRRSGTFDVDALIDAYGNCPAWFLQTCFLFMSPIRNFFDKTIAFCEQMDDPAKRRELLRARALAQRQHPGGGRDVPRRSSRTCISATSWCGASSTSADGASICGRITCPLLLLTADDDHLVAPASTEGIRPHVGSARHHVDGDRRRARRPGGRRQGAREALAGGDALDGRAIHACALATAVATPAGASPRLSRLPRRAVATP